MILAQPDRDGLADVWTLAAEPAALDYEVRWARDPRLIEAHEQLVLGAQTCWIGDSMRRDPTKCDAFESYVEGCGEAAGCALVSFLNSKPEPQPPRATGRRDVFLLERANGNECASRKCPRR
jgi:hypothetical protein